MSDEAKGAAVVGFIFGLVVMGVLMTFVGSTSQYKVNGLRDKCELNIPRNQSCVMQFVPEKK